MDSFSITAGIILTLGVLFYITYPLFSPNKQGFSLDEISDLSLFERRDQLLPAIEELEFDRDLDKLSPEDYRRLRSTIESEAVHPTRQLDEKNGSSAPFQDRIEREVLALRSRTTLVQCPSCSAIHNPEDHFCPQCGTRLIPKKE